MFRQKNYFTLPSSIMFLALFAGLLLPEVCFAEKFRLPNVVDKPLQMVAQNLTTRGLVISILPGSKTDIPEQVSIVQRQDPPAGTMVQAGDKINLWAYQSSKWTKPVISMPYVLNQKVEDAKDKIKQAGFGAIIVKPWKGNLKKMDGRVSLQSPPEYRLAEKGSKVELLVYEYDPSLPRQLVVPDVVGLDKESAENKLNEAGFKQVKNFHRAINTPLPEKDGKIARQSPRAGAKIMNNRKVTIYVHKYREPAPTVKVPNVVGKKREDAMRILLGLGLRPSVQKPPHWRRGSDNAEGEVVAQNPSAGTKVKTGQKIRLNLSATESEILPGLYMAKRRVLPGTLISVRFSIPPELARLGWLRACPLDDDACRSAGGQKPANPLIGPIKLSGRTKGEIKFKAPKNPGKYDLQMMVDPDNARELVSVTFEVLPPSVAK